jgi:uncharacterized protein
LLLFVKVPILTIRASRAVVLALSLIAGSIGILAQPPAPEKIRPKSYVTDLAGVVDGVWNARIESLCSELDAKTHTQLAVVTIRSLEGEPIEEYANRWLRAWGIGRKENKGALLLLVIQDKKMRLEVGYGLEPVLPDGFSGSVLREMREPLRGSNYGEALYNGAHTVAERVASQAGVQLGAAPRAPSGSSRRSARSAPSPFLSFLPIIVIVLLILAARRRSRGGGGVVWYGGGGFGGYDGGGSGGGGGSDFGGFGGGDSGGGGASSDW